MTLDITAAERAATEYAELQGKATPRMWIHKVVGNHHGLCLWDGVLVCLAALSHKPTHGAPPETPQNAPESISTPQDDP